MALDPFGTWGLKEWPKGGGAGLRRKPEPALEPADEPESMQPEPQPEKKDVVVLTNPKWLVDEATFEQKVGLSVDVLLPESLKEIKRVIITVYSVSPKGVKSQVKARDLYVDQGEVTGEFELATPPKEDGKGLEACDYLFTAKHRDSKEIESPRLHAKSKANGSEILELELPSPDETESGGQTFRLKSNDGSIDAKMAIKDGQEKEGKITLKFQKLDPMQRYSLELMNGKGEVVEAIFTDTQFGKWAEDSK